MQTETLDTTFTSMQRPFMKPFPRLGWGCPLMLLKRPAAIIISFGLQKRLSKQRCGVGIKGAVKFSTAGKPADEVAGCPGERCKESTNDYFTVRLQRQSILPGRRRRD